MGFYQFLKCLLISFLAPLPQFEFFLFLQQGDGGNPPQIGREGLIANLLIKIKKGRHAELATHLTHRSYEERLPFPSKNRLKLAVPQWAFGHAFA
jgi:hypothetical protein